MVEPQTAVLADQDGCETAFATGDSNGASGLLVVEEGTVPRLIERFTSLSLRPEDGWHTADGRPATSQSEGALRKIGLDEYEVCLAGKVRRIRTQYEDEATQLLQRMQLEQEALETLKRSASRKGDSSRRSWRRRLRAQQQALTNAEGEALSNGQLQGLKTGGGTTVLGSSSEVSGASSDYDEEGGEDWTEEEEEVSNKERHQLEPSPRTVQLQQQLQPSVDSLGSPDLSGSPTSVPLGADTQHTCGRDTGASNLASSSSSMLGGSGSQELLRVVSAPPPLAGASSGPLEPTVSSPLPSSSSTSQPTHHQQQQQQHHHHRRSSLSGERYVSLVGRPVLAPGQMPQQSGLPKPSPQKEVLVKEPAPFDPLAANSLYEDPLRQVLFPLAPGAAEDDSDSDC